MGYEYFSILNKSGVGVRVAILVCFRHQNMIPGSEII